MKHCAALADALRIRQSPSEFTERGVALEPELPGSDPHAPSLLGRAGLRHPPAIRHGDGGRNFPPGDGAALAWAGRMARLLRPAVPPSDRRPLWREPQPPRPLLPVS